MIMKQTIKIIIFCILLLNIAPFSSAEYKYNPLPFDYYSTTATETDPFSVHIDGSTPLTANWDAGAFDIKVLSASSKKMINTPIGTQSVTAATDTISSTNGILNISSDADYLMASTPTIAAGVDGQWLILRNTGTFIITLQDNAVLADSDIFHGSTGGTLNPNEVMTMLYTAEDGGGWEIQSHPNIQTAEGATGITVRAGEALAGALLPVYVSGYNVGLGILEVSIADQDDPTKMPAIGVTLGAISLNATGTIITSGTIARVDTSTFALGDSLWVSDSGTLVNTKPTLDDIQAMAIVSRSNVATGSIMVVGAGRANDLPRVGTMTTLTVDDYSMDNDTLGSLKKSLARYKQSSGILNQEDAVLVSNFDGDAGTEWTKTTGTSVDDDTTNVKRGAKSIKWDVTPADTGTAADKTVSLDLTEHDVFHLRYFLENAAECTGLSIYFSTSGSYAQYYLTSVESQYLNEGWNDFSFVKSDFSDSGSADWSTVNLIRIRLNATGASASVYCTFDEFTVYKSPLERGVVILCLDDCHETQIAAREYMDAYRFRGSAFVIPEKIGEANYLTLAQVKNLKEVGWDICPHGFTRLDTMTAGEIKTELESIVEYMNINDIGGSSFFAYPGGLVNQTVLTEMPKYFDYCRLIDGKLEGSPIVSPYLVSSKQASKTTSQATVEGWVDTAIANKEVLILAFHEIRAVEDEATSWSEAKFSGLMAYLNTNKEDIDILNWKEFLQRYKDREATTYLGTLNLSNQLTSTVAIGTAPFVITSTTEVANLKAATVGTITGLAPDTQNTYARTQYLIPYASTTTAMTGIAIGDDGQILTSGGAGVAPSFEDAAGGAGGATYREMTLLPQGAVLDDDNPAVIDVVESTGTGTPRFYRAKFDDGDIDLLYYSFIMPSDATASADVILDIYWYSDEDVAENVVWGAQVSATTPDDADNCEEQAADTRDTVTDSADASEAKALIKATITIDYANMDGAVAGDWVVLSICRVGDDGSDTHSNECYFVSGLLKIPRS